MKFINHKDYYTYYEKKIAGSTSLSEGLKFKKYIKVRRHTREISF